MATPEWFAKLKRRTAEIIDFENDALERDMVRSQETPSEAQETEEDGARRLRVEREQQEEMTRRGGETVRAVYCRDTKREKDDAGRTCRKNQCDR